MIFIAILLAIAVIILLIDNVRMRMADGDNTVGAVADNKGDGHIELSADADRVYPDLPPDSMLEETTTVSAEDSNAEATE